MTYAAEIAKLSRTPVTLAVMTLDWCANTFGVAPCTATGTPCYNTYPTCKDRANYVRTTRDYKFTSVDAPLPFPGPRPYLKQVSWLPTEIKDTLTVNARVTLNLVDEPDDDVGIDPYPDQRAGVQGTFWKKLLARNPNLERRRMRIYEGALGLAENEFELRWVGEIAGVRLERGEVRLEVVDLLKALDKIDVPIKFDGKLLNAVDASQTEIILTKVDQLVSAGYIRVGDEIIQYAGIDPAQNKLTGCTRGAFGTTAATASANARVRPVAYYPPQNPFDLLKSMLLNSDDPTVNDPRGAGYDAADVDTAVFDYWRDWPGGEIDVSAIVVEPTKLGKLYFELIDLFDLKSWYSEGQKITIARNVPNEPGRQYAAWSDDENIVHGSASADLNQESRFSRVILRYDKKPLGKDKEEGDYLGIEVAVEAEAESDNEYGKVVEEVISTRWIQRGAIQEEVLSAFLRGLTARRLLRRRDALPMVDLEVEIKDGAVKTGEFVRLSTDELLMPDGRPLDRQIFQVIKRNPKGHQVAYRVIKTAERKIALFAPAGTPDRDLASEAEQEYGFFSDATGKMADGETDGYYFW